MALHIPYTGDTFRPSSKILPGNDTAEVPLEFDLVPPWGPDLARVKSLIYATLGLIDAADWRPEVQAAVTRAFDTGAPVFANTITAIRGLTVPAAMAVRAGLLTDLPQTIVDGQARPDHAKPIPITTGQAFSRICGALPALSFQVASELSKLAEQAERAMDPRFFEPPSGSSGTATDVQEAATSVATARRRSGKRATADNGSDRTGR